MSKSAKQAPQDKLDLYERLVATNPSIEQKGKTTAYTSVNGHMFTYLSKEGTLGIRLPKEARETFLTEYNTTLFAQHGTIMKEYVTVPDALLQNTEELKPYLDSSYAYVQSLKPKPTKKKKKK